jgi:menaquinone-dependent protoporphyrinogen IX oxidase
MSSYLIVYYDLGEVKKVAERIKSKLKEKHKVDIFELELKEEMDIKDQFKKEKELELKKNTSISKYDYVILGTPISSFRSVPAVNVFIRNIKNIKKQKFILYATGIGLPGKAIKKMSSLLLMKKGKVIHSKVFSSIFEFDENKLKEVDAFSKEFK